MKKIILISFLTIPLSVLIVLIADVIMVSTMGGIATIKGFPIPYYRDVWSTPQIDYYIPIMKFVDIGLIYTLTTFIGFKLFKK